MNSGNSSVPANQDSKTLWVGDIENWMDESHIANLFSKIGPVQSVKIIRDKASGQPMGYGFVEFTSHEIAARVIQLLNGSTNPSTNKYNFVYSSDHSDSIGVFLEGIVENQGALTEAEETTLILVRILTIRTTTTKFMRKYDSVVDAKIIVDQTTKMSKGYGFVQFSNYEESQKAIQEMQGSLLKGKPIKVNQGFSRSNSTHRNHSGGHHSQGNNHGKDHFGMPKSPQGRNSGNILGGLGVQINANDQKVNLGPQFASYPGVSGVQGGQIAIDYSQNPNAALIAQSMAAQQQQLLLYHQALARQQAGLPVNETNIEELKQQDLQLQALAQTQVQLQGLYPPGNVMGIQGLNPALNPGLHPVYASQLGGFAGQQVSPIGLSGLPPIASTKEEPTIAKKAPSSQQQIEEPSLEILSNSKLALLHFVQNYDLKTN